MEFMLDTADVARIRDLNELITVAGVTTNPSILTKSGRMPEDVLPEIISILSRNRNSLYRSYRLIMPASWTKPARSVPCARKTCM